MQALRINNWLNNDPKLARIEFNRTDSRALPTGYITINARLDIAHYDIPSYYSKSRHQHGQFRSELCVSSQNTLPLPSEGKIINSTGSRRRRWSFSNTFAQYVSGYIHLHIHFDPWHLKITTVKVSLPQMRSLDSVSYAHRLLCIVY